MVFFRFYPRGERLAHGSDVLRQPQRATNP